MKKYGTAVFDVDGTLLDTTEGVLCSVKYTIDKFGLKPLSHECLLTFIGPPVQDSFANIYGLNGEILQELADTFRDRYKNIDLLKAQPYPGIYDTLTKLKDKGIMLAIATYKRQDYAIDILKHFKFDRFTNILYGSDNYNKLKKKDIIEKCLKEIGLTDYSNAVMIGDSESDAIGAEQIGMNFLGVTYGFGFKTKKDIMKYQNIGCANEVNSILPFFI